MSNLITNLNKQTDDKYSYLKLEHCDLYQKDKKVSISFLIPSSIYDEKYNDEYLNQLTEDVKKLIPSYFAVDIVLKKSFADVEIVSNFIYEYIRTNYVAIASALKKTDIVVEQGDGFSISITMPEHIKSFIEANNFADTLKSKLSDNFCEATFKVIMKYVEADVQLAEDKIYDEEDIYVAPETIKVADVSTWIGADIESLPYKIEDCQKEMGYCVLAGKISSIVKRVSKKSEKIFFTYMLNDPTGTVQGLYFPRGNNVAKMEAITEGKEVVIKGAMRADDRSGGYKMWMDDLSFCTIDWDVKTDIRYNPVPKDYRCTEPVPYIETKQSNMFEEEEIPLSLLGKTFVVFDTETTGLDTNKCEIIDIAGIKVVDGHITETFSSYVYPKLCEVDNEDGSGKHIELPEETVALTHITSEDVADAPLPFVVMADFYKFTRGAILVAHNASYDMPIIKRVGKDARFLFDNDCYDTLAIARKQYPNFGKHTLGYLCDKFGIELIDAHRAYNDAMATTKLFIKLAKDM